MADLLPVVDGRSADSHSPRARREGGAVRLSEALQGNPNLTEVRLCVRDQPGGDTASSPTRLHSHTQQLNLEGSDIGVVGGTKIGQVLGANSVLQKLNLVRSCVSHNEPHEYGQVCPCPGESSAVDEAGVLVSKSRILPRRGRGLPWYLSVFIGASRQDKRAAREAYSPLPCPHLSAAASYAEDRRRGSYLAGSTPPDRASNKCMACGGVLHEHGKKLHLFPPFYSNGEYVGVDGAHYLAQALHTNTTLTELRTDSITPQGGTKLARALGANSTLLALHLGPEHSPEAFPVKSQMHNHIGSAGATHLAAALRGDIPGKKQSKFQQREFVLNCTQLLYSAARRGWSRACWRQGLVL